MTVSIDELIKDERKKEKKKHRDNWMKRIYYQQDYL